MRHWLRIALAVAIVAVALPAVVYMFHESWVKDQEASKLRKEWNAKEEACLADQGCDLERFDRLRAMDQEVAEATDSAQAAGMVGGFVMVVGSVSVTVLEPWARQVA